MPGVSFVAVCRESVSRHQRVLVAVTTGLAFLCTVLGLALPYWVSSDSERTFFVPDQSDGSITTTRTLGLWQICTSISCDGVPEESQEQNDCGSRECKRINTLFSDGIPGWLTASRLFMTLGLIGSLVLVLLGGLFVCNEQHRENQNLKRVFYICAFLAGISVAEAVMIAGIGSDDSGVLSSDAEFHAAFGLSCVAIFANLAVGILVWLLVKPEENGNQNGSEVKRSNDEDNYDDVINN